MQRHRTGGMTAIAVLDIVLGGIQLLAGLFSLLGSFVFMFELLRMGAFEVPLPRVAFSLLLLATGIVGIAAGIGTLRLRSWAQTLSLAYAALLILSSALSFLVLPIVASIAMIGSYDVGSLSSYDLARLIGYGAVHVVFPVSYALLLCVVFCTPAWRATFAKADAA